VVIELSPEVRIKEFGEGPSQPNVQIRRFRQGSSQRSEGSVLRSGSGG
jgi:hypothetical protein